MVKPVSPEPSDQPSAAVVVAALEASRGSLMKSIAGLDEAAFRARPAAGRSPAEVLAHLLVTEEEALALARADPAPADSDDEGRLAQRTVVPQIIHGLLARRRESARLLDEGSPNELGRRLGHPRWGALSVAGLFQRLAAHESEHAGELAASREQKTAPAL